MKIGILTHPLCHNFGGVLQAYALYTYLRYRGHDVYVIKQFKTSPKEVIKKVVIPVLKMLHIRHDCVIDYVQNKILGILLPEISIIIFIIKILGCSVECSQKTFNQSTKLLIKSRTKTSCFSKNSS